MNVTLRQLAAALAVARRQNFRRAAEDVHLSQPALSLSVAELERQLGISLFDRTSRNVRTTAAGASFLAEAGRLLGDLDALLRDVRDTVESHRGRVVVACIASAAARLMPLAMRTSGDRHPNIDLQIRDDVTARVTEMVRSGETDFGIIANLSEQPEELEFENLLEDPFFLAVPLGHRVASKKEARWSDLSGETFIAFATTSGIHVTIEEELRRGGIRPHRTIAVSQLAVVHGMLEAGVGVSILPRLALPIDGHPSIDARPLIAPAMARSVGIVQRRDRSLSPAAKAFVAVLRDVANR